MTTNAMINEMFEELKEKLQAIEGKLGERTRDMEPVSEERLRQQQQSRQAVEHTLQRISSHLEGIRKDSNSTSLEIKDLETRLNQKLDKHLQAEQQQSRLKLNRKSIIHLLLFLILFVAASITINFYQAERISKMRKIEWENRLTGRKSDVTKDHLKEMDLPSSI